MRSLTSRNSASFCANLVSRSSIAGRPRVELLRSLGRRSDLLHQRLRLELLRHPGDRHALDDTELVARHDQERVAFRTHVLVLVSLQLRNLDAVALRAFADERQRIEIAA